MSDLAAILRQFSANAGAIRSLIQPISLEQSLWKPNPETWSLKEVIEHVYNEERIDFRKHLKEMFADPPQPWGKFSHEEFVQVESCSQALEGFLKERQASIVWLEELQSPDWDISTQAVFGPSEEIYVLTAGDVLNSWLAHDFLHMRQMIELLYAWEEKQAAPYALDYAGGW